MRITIYIGLAIYALLAWSLIIFGGVKWLMGS